MKKYKIPVNIVFSGYVEVKARDKEEAAKKLPRYNLPL